MSESNHPEEELEPAEVLNLYGLSQTADYLIAKIKAEALREAAESVRNEAPGEPYAGALFTSHATWLDERADRIEGAINE